MPSEIPQIEVVTAIGEADFEDYVAQLLFSQGWNIINRAFDMEKLIEFMGNRTGSNRTVLVYTSDLPGFDEAVMTSLHQTPDITISLDGVPHIAHEIMQRVRGQLRIPLLQKESESAVSAPKHAPRISEARRKVILVTGSSGGPGKTLFSATLSSALSSQRKVTLVDADLRSVPLESYLPADNFSILSFRADQKPHALPSTPPQELIVIDAGILPPLGEVVNDRRWLALLHNHFLEEATNLIYVCQSTKASLMQLAQFKKEFPLLLQKINPTFICVVKGSKKDTKAAIHAFEQIVAGENYFLIDEMSLLPQPSGVVDSLLSSGGRQKKEIGTIVSSLL